MTAVLWLSVPALPLLLASLRLFPGLRQVVPALMPLGAAPALAVAAWNPSPTALPWLLLGSEMGLDPAGRILLTLTGLLWGAAALFCLGHFRNDARRDSFMTYFLLTMSGNLWLIISRDPATFYAAFALMTFAAYGLVVHTKTQEAVRAGRIYLVMAVLGEVCIATGLWMLVSGGALSVSEVLPADRPAATFFLLLVGFGIKAGVLPLHVWLPLAHPVAPTPASAVLSGTMIKAGLLGWLRFLPAQGPEAAAVLITCGITGAVGAALLGLFQKNPKTILAYSSISQMGWMVVGVSVFVAVPSLREEAVAAVALYALHHGLVKGGLFLSLGIAGCKKSGTRFLRTGQAVLALAMVAAPATGGAAAKHLVKELVPFLPAPWPHALSWLFPVAATGTGLIMIRFLVAAWSGDGRTSASVSGPSQWAGWLFIAVLAPVLPLAMAGNAHGAVSGLSGQLFPLVAAGLLAFAAVGFLRRRGTAPPTVPAGDILLPLEALSRRLFAFWKSSIGPVLGRMRQAVYSHRWHEPHEVRVLQHVLDGGERWWGRWSVCGLLFLCILIAAALMMIPGTG